MPEKKQKSAVKVEKSKVGKAPVEIGKITHYFTNIMVAVVELSGELKKGDKIIVKGASTNFEQTVDSMQIDRVDIEEAKKGDAIGLKVKEHARPGDLVYKL